MSKDPESGMTQYEVSKEWSINVRGTKKQVKERVGQDEKVPEVMKSALDKILSLMSDQQHVMMETHGQVTSLDANATIRVTSLSPGKS